MKLRVLTLLGVLALGAGTVIHAQDYDDIYYDGSKTTTAVKKETKRVETTKTRTEVPTRYKVTVEKNYQTERDVDEYNRRGGIYAQLDNDTLYLDSLAYDDQSMFGKTQRIERFYNPDVVVLSDDDELVELYYDNAPTVNLVIGSNYGYSPRVGWGIGYGSYWYDPWYSLYDPFYDPWYYSGWYGWHRPYYGWHTPWYYSYWGWGNPWHGVYTGWYGWGHPWGGHYWGGGPGRYWGGPGAGHWANNQGRWHGGRHANRLPGDNRSLLTGGRRAGMTTTSSRGIRAANGNTRGTSAGTITNGRTRPSTMSGVTAGRTRPSGRVGNINRSTTSGMTGGYSGGSVRNRGTSSSSTTRSYSPGSSSSSRSYSPRSPSRSSSYGSSGSSRSYSGGGYSSGSSRSGGGFSGGGSSRSGGGGGGGGRRH